MIEYRELADAVTYGRVLANGGVIGSLITAPPNDEYSWGRAWSYGAACTGDVVDGWLARRDSRGTNDHGAMLDQTMDKVASYATEGTIAIKHRDPVAGVSVAVDLMRDRIVNGKRREIIAVNKLLDEQGKPEIALKARKLGKIKTLAKSVTNGFAMSPLGEKYPNTIRLMRVGCMALTVASGVDFVKKADQALVEFYADQNGSGLYQEGAFSNNSLS
ncbi:MAG TPA: CDP-alcohol phosphatidyltransferase family protein [Candidatus Saccharimonadales bacterium]|nr:CDP-alcohol phosphatidyltransferase family protein [Candidatus Saccharimonadales bacterium]